MPDHRDLYTPEVLAGLEAIIAAQEEKDTLPKLVNDLLREKLMDLGLIPYEDVPAGVVDPDA